MASVFRLRDSFVPIRGLRKSFNSKGLVLQMKWSFMSLTLRDAQHLSWKTLKKLEIVDEKRAALVSTSDALVKKAVEIAQKMKKLEDSEAGKEGKIEVGTLLSQLLFTAFVLAEHSGIELEDSFMQNVDEIILGFVS
jgi:NTP pyrophosphatase (non-canonical NTP hydrolase)